MSYAVEQIEQVSPGEPKKIISKSVCPPDYANLRGVCSYAVPVPERDFTAAGQEIFKPNITTEQFLRHLQK